MDLVEHTQPGPQKNHGEAHKAAVDGQHVASRYTRAHRSIQQFLGLCVLDSLVNDTMMVAQRMADMSYLDPRAAVCKSEQANRDDVRGWEDMEVSDDESEDAVEEESEQPPSIEEQIEFIVGRKVVLEETDVPHNTLHFSAYSMTHTVDTATSGEKSRRLLSVAPKVLQSYDRDLQRPPSGVSHTKPEFYRELEGSNPCSTSWIFEHGREILHQRFLKHADDNADPYFRVWTDVPNNVNTHYVRVRSTLEEVYCDPWSGTSNQNQHHAIVNPDRADVVFSDKDDSFRVPLHLFYPDRHCDSYDCNDKGQQPSSLADSIVFAGEGRATTARSFRETATEHGVVTAWGR